MRQCLAGRKVLLVGDEQMQPTYWAVVQTLGGSVPNRGMGEQEWRDAKGTAMGVRLWDTWLYNSRLVDAAKARKGVRSDGPALTSIGAGIGYPSQTGIDGFASALDSLGLTQSSSSR